MKISFLLWSYSHDKTVALVPVTEMSVRRLESSSFLQMAPLVFTVYGLSPFACLIPLVFINTRFKLLVNKTEHRYECVIKDEKMGPLASVWSLCVVCQYVFFILDTSILLHWSYKQTSYAKNITFAFNNSFWHKQTNKQKLFIFFLADYRTFHVTTYST